MVGQRVELGRLSALARARERRQHARRHARARRQPEVRGVRRLRGRGEQRDVQVDVRLLRDERGEVLWDRDVGGVVGRGEDHGEVVGCTLRGRDCPRGGRLAGDRGNVGVEEDARAGAMHEVLEDLPVATFDARRT